MIHENFLQSTGQVDPAWEEARRDDINFTHALLGVAEHLSEPDQRALIADLLNGGLITHGSTGSFERYKQDKPTLSSGE